MAREAFSLAFNDGVGFDVDCYINNNDKIRSFLEWYTDICQKKNEILYVIGPKGSGKSAFLQHCSNFISNKANYELLMKKGLAEIRDSFSALPKARWSWISGQEILAENGAVIDVLCNKIKPQGLFRNFGPYISSTLSYGPGSPEISLKFGAKIPPGYESIETLTDYLKKKKDELYVVWFKSVPSDKCETIAAIYNDIKTAGALNLGIVISIDQESSLSDLELLENSIVFETVTEEELILLIHSVCSKNKIRYDLGLAKLIISHGINTYEKSLHMLAEAEKIDRSYISRENVLSRVEVLK